jgi:hypothetical protein
MNLLECIVTNVIGEPYWEYDCWWQQVEYICYGHTETTSLMYKNKEDLNEVVVGFKFLN